MANPSLPDCDPLFMKYFDRWYEADDRTRKGFDATCPDVLSHKFKVGVTPSQICVWDAETQRKISAQIDRMADCAIADWRKDYGIENAVSIEGLEAFDLFFDAPTLLACLERSDPKDYSNEYVVICCELGAVLGKVLRTLRPDYEWVWDMPYWESFLYDPKTTDVFKVFHWAIKRLSGYGLEDGLVPKLEFAAQQPWKNKK